MDWIKIEHNKTEQTMKDYDRASDLTLIDLDKLVRVYSRNYEHCGTKYYADLAATNIELTQIEFLMIKERIEAKMEASQ